MEKQDIYSIGQAAKLCDVSSHTLRYYEKIKLLPNISKNAVGNRIYQQKDINLIHFIKRAQRMQFSLDEIKQLIVLDQSASMPKPEARQLVKNKLDKISESLHDLQLLKTDLSNLLQACQCSNEKEKCPILEGIKNDEN